MQARLDDAETTALKSGKRMLAKLDQRIRDLEAELAEECRRHAETLKNYRNRDRRVRELQFQVDEDKKGAERMYDLIEKLQAKIKTYKRQLEETVGFILSCLQNTLYESQICFSTCPSVEPFTFSPLKSLN